jgi:serine phosphatase RsbU (regulator of sigma subunit)
MDSKILFLGMVVVSGCTIHDVMKDLGVFNSTVVLYWYGIFFFLLSQGSILFRRIYNVQKNYELKENELMVAQKIQNTLLPQIPSRLGDWELVSFYSPMKEVGGDFYDFVQDEEGNFGIIILDVSGHGVGASIIASMAKISFSNSSASMNNPGELLKEMNRSLSGKIGDNFATGFYIYGNSHQSTISFSSAGHPSSFLVSHINNDVVEFRTKSKPIGIFKDYDYSSSYIYLNEGDILFLYTDGITELQSPEGEEIGEARVKEILLKNSLFDLNMIKTALIREFQLWTGSPHLSKEDDLSFLLLRYKSNF